MSNEQILILIGFMLPIGAFAIFCIKIVIDDIYKKKHYTATAIGKIVDVDWEAKEDTKKRKRRQSLLMDAVNPEPTHILYYHLVEFEGKTYKTKSFMREALPKDTEVMVQYNPEKPEEFFLSEYESIETVKDSIIAVAATAFFVAIIFLIFKYCIY